ncbi:MAG: fumarylacetoacetate hydrolase family protein [Gemmataceae bacterium]|nr:fumarylacetoacetate hydrolase family protein [Gemmataceae bacterium]
MQLAKVHYQGQIRYGLVQGDSFVLFNWTGTLGDILSSPQPERLAKELVADSTQTVSIREVTFLAPVDQQEVWAAGVTYKRSKIAREEESVGAAQFYDKVYSAPRPELFLKAPAWRVVAPLQPVRIREDGRWNVPEPELALVISPTKKIVGFTIGNDMSSRDIEGENPLYLPQAKIYDGSCSIGPVITLASSMPSLAAAKIRLLIQRGGQTVFDGSTDTGMLNRTPESLVEWLTKELSFPYGAILLTGTGIVPPDDFTLARGDVISISIDGIGTLTNPVA